MGSSVDTRERDAAYWAALRASYSEKLDYLLNERQDFASWNDPHTFYRTMFPAGTLETAGRMIDWHEPGGGKGNLIAVEVTSKTKESTAPSGRTFDRPVVRRYTITDDLEKLYDLIEESSRSLWPVYVAPVTYFGKSRSAKNARFLHAFVVDLDGVGLQELKNLVKQMECGVIPTATDIVLSGRGVHLYYRLLHPVPLVPKHVPSLQLLKHCLIDMVWNGYTSNIPSSHDNNQRQYQGIYQAFRIPGSSTRLNGCEPGQKKTNEYPCVAFDVFGRHPYTLEELASWLPKATSKAEVGKIEEFAKLWETGGRTSLARARELWPEWYERRIERGEEPSGWSRPVNRAAYESWLARIKAEATVGHRYNTIVGLAAYARKCGISYDELENDAMGLLGRYNEIAEDPSEEFRVSDVLGALRTYDDDDAKTYTNAYMCRIAGIEKRTNRRNGRKQDVHLAGARAIQEVNDRFNGTNWRDGNGRKPKRDLVREYAYEHQDASHSAIARELGVSRPTVIKWLMPGWKDEWERELEKRDLETITPVPIPDDVPVVGDRDAAIGLLPRDFAKVASGTYSPEGAGNFVYVLVPERNDD